MQIVRKGVLGSLITLMCVIEGAEPKHLPLYTDSHVQAILSQTPDDMHTTFKDEHRPLTNVSTEVCDRKQGLFKGGTVLLSIVGGEQTPLLLNAVLNALNFTTSNTIVVLHVNKRASETFLGANSAALEVLHTYTKQCRFILNHFRMPVFTMHGSILLAHMLNIAYARDQGVQFDSVILMASNMRFYRCGIEKSIQVHGSSVNLKSADGKGCIFWGGNMDHPRIWKDDAFWKVFYNLTAAEAAAKFEGSEELVMQWGYHEGFYAHASAFHAFHRFLVERRGYQHLWDIPYCAEEFWLQTYMAMIKPTLSVGAVTPTKTFTCVGDSSTLLRFDEPWHFTIEQFHEVLRKPLPHPYYSIKRVARNMSDPVLLLLTDMGAEVIC